MGVREDPASHSHLSATGTDYLGGSRFELTLTDEGRQAAAAKTSCFVFERPGWSIRVETGLTVTSRTAAFDVGWRVRAVHDGRTLFDHTGESEVPR